MTALTSAAMRTMMQFHQETVLVSVSGIDGSGKTDLIKSVVNELQQSGIEAASARFDLVDVIPGHSLPDYIYSLFMRSGHTTDSDAIIGDCITFEYLKFHMETVGACQPHVRVLVLDRYIWDYLLTNEIVFRALTTTQQSLMRAIPLPQVKIFLDCDPDTAINRIVKRPEKRTQLERRDILEEKRSRYLAMSRELAGTVIDGTLSKSDVHNQAMAAISYHLKAPAE